MSGYRANNGPIGYLKDKYQELKGVDAERARQTRIEKLGQKITEVSVTFTISFKKR